MVLARWLVLTAFFLGANARGQGALALRLRSMLKNKMALHEMHLAEALGWGEGENTAGLLYRIRPSIGREAPNAQADTCKTRDA